MIELMNGGIEVMDVLMCALLDARLYYVAPSPAVEA